MWGHWGAVVVNAGARGRSSEAIELHMEGGRVCPLYGHGRYGVVPPKAPDILPISVLQIPLPHHTIGRRHPWRFPPNAAIVEVQGDDHCEREPCWCVPSWNRRFQSAHLGETCTPTPVAGVGWEVGDWNGG